MKRWPGSFLFLKVLFVFVFLCVQCSLQLSKLSKLSNFQLSPSKSSQFDQATSARGRHSRAVSSFSYYFVVIVQLLLLLLFVVVRCCSMPFDAVRCRSLPFVAVRCCSFHSEVGCRGKAGVGCCSVFPRQMLFLAAQALFLRPGRK